MSARLPAKRRCNQNMKFEHFFLCCRNILLMIWPCRHISHNSSNKSTFLTKQSCTTWFLFKKDTNKHNNKHICDLLIIYVCSLKVRRCKRLKKQKSVKSFLKSEFQHILIRFYPYAAIEFCFLFKDALVTYIFSEHPFMIML